MFSTLNEAIRVRAIWPPHHNCGGLGRPASGRDNGDMSLPSELTLGSLTVDTPVVLAPMAGITNAAVSPTVRSSSGSAGLHGLFVCEMITSRGLVEGDETTKKMLVFDEMESVRSVQLYGTDPVYVGKAVEILCADYGVAHVDLNFGCPVPKVTRKGGGGALPWKRGLLAGHPDGGGRRRGGVRRAGDDEDPQGPRRRPPHVSRRRPDRTGVRRARRSRCTGGPSSRPTPATADWDAIAAARRVTSTSPCSATVTSGRRLTRVRMVEETGAAGVVVGADAWDGRGSSATSRPPSTARTSRPCRPSARWL